MSTPKTSESLTPQQQLEAMGYKQELRRELKFVDLVIYGMIFMVPIAPWALFGTIYNQGQGMVPMVYTVGLVAMIFTALSYSQMAKAIPMAGSVYNYVGKGVHPGVGFFAGWLILLDYMLTPTLLYVFAAESMIGIFPGTPRLMWALLFVAINVGVNILGVSSLKWMNRIFLIMEVIFIMIFFIIAIPAINNGTAGAAWSVKPMWDMSIMTPALIASALSIAALNFLGFDGISTLAEEAKGGRQTAGRAMVTALLVVGFLFISQTWLASNLHGDYKPLPDDGVGNAFFDLVRGISNNPTAIAFLICNVLAVGIANAMAAQAATSRLLYSMARDGQMPKFLGKISERQVPRNAILLVGVLSAILVSFFVGQMDMISSMVNFGALTAFLLLHVAVVVFYLVRQRKGNWFLHGMVPALGFLIIGYVLLNASVLAKLAGVVWLGIGLGLFLYFRHKGISIEMAEESEDRS